MVEDEGNAYCGKSKSGDDDACYCHSVCLTLACVVCRSSCMLERIVQAHVAARISFVALNCLIAESATVREPRRFRT